MQERLTRAISERRLIGFFYEGRVAIVEPRLLGRNRARELILGGWRLIDGKHHWQEYKVSKMSSLLERRGSFTGSAKAQIGSVVEVLSSNLVTIVSSDGRDCFEA